MYSQEEAYVYCKQKMEAHKFYFLDKFHISEDLFHDAFHDSFIYVFSKYDPTRRSKHDPTKGIDIFTLLWKKMHLRILKLKHREYRQRAAYLTYDDGYPCLECGSKEKCTNHGDKKCRKMKAYNHAAKGAKHFSSLITDQTEVTREESVLDIQGLFYQLIQQDPTVLLLATELCQALLSPIPQHEIKITTVENLVQQTNMSRGGLYQQLQRCTDKLKKLIERRRYYT